MISAAYQIALPADHSSAVHAPAAPVIQTIGFADDHRKRCAKTPKRPIAFAGKWLRRRNAAPRAPRCSLPDIARAGGSSRCAESGPFWLLAYCHQGNAATRSMVHERRPTTSVSLGRRGRPSPLPTHIPAYIGAVNTGVAANGALRRHHYPAQPYGRAPTAGAGGALGYCCRRTAALNFLPVTMGACSNASPSSRRFAS